MLMVCCATAIKGSSEPRTLNPPKKKAAKGVKKDKGAGKDKPDVEKKTKKSPQMVPKEEQHVYKEQLVLAS